MRTPNYDAAPGPETPRAQAGFLSPGGVWVWVLLIAGLLASPALLGQGKELAVKNSENFARAALTPAQAKQVGAFAAALFHDGNPASTDLPEVFARAPGVVQVAVRSSGRRLAYAWAREASGEAALRTALRSLARDLAGAEHPPAATLEINLAHSFRTVDPRTNNAKLSNAYRGLLGLEVRAGGQFYRYAPTEMIAQNLDFDRVLDRLAERAQVRRVALGGSFAPVRLFEADQLLVELAPVVPHTTLLYRGNTVVPIEAITRPSVERLADAQSQWLTNNLQADGRMVYLYWPSRGEESSDNNEVRQWMASVALGRLASSRGEATLTESAVRNIRFNLARSYSQDAAGFGLIVEDGTTVKLGALAIAGLALVESPQRNAFAAQEAALLRTISAMWQTNGEFRTFWQPKDRKDNANFYPGEALVLWATLYAQSKDPALLDRIMASVRFYREWHRANRNPAFVPWHTQACFKVWEITRSEELRDWMFEMNDWLLGVQQWDSQREFPDTMGRFYAPDRPFGPPHASSTGVYMEGLIDAWRVAQGTCDSARQENYRRSLIRALRSITQLTFLDATGMFYVSKRDKVFGGVRTTVYDNSIRVDNVQHNLMAIQQILRYLPAGDFRP